MGRFHETLDEDPTGWQYKDGGLVVIFKEKHGFLRMGVYPDTLKKMLDGIIAEEEITLIFKETGECLFKSREGDVFSLEQFYGEGDYQRLSINGKRYLVTQYQEEGRGLIYFRLLPKIAIMKEILNSFLSLR